MGAMEAAAVQAQEDTLRAAARAGAEADGLDPDALITAYEAGFTTDPDSGIMVPAWQAYIRQARLTLAMVNGAWAHVSAVLAAKAGQAADPPVQVG